MSKSLNPQPLAFACTLEQLAMRDEARRYCMAEFHPLEQRMDEEALWPEELFQKLGRMGYLGMTIPEAYGGTGLDYLTAGMVLEVIAEAIVAEELLRD